MLCCLKKNGNNPQQVQQHSAPLSDMTNTIHAIDEVSMIPDWDGQP